MSELLESNEFGDWLLCEVSQMRAQLKSAHPDAAPISQARLETLKAAKTILLEFLTLQQQMFDAASAACREDHPSIRASAASSPSGLVRH
jgi:Asp/Glu/hydantoin racemase